MNDIQRPPEEEGIPGFQEFEDQPYSVMHEEASDLTKWQLDSKQIIENLRHELMGEYFDEEKGKYSKIKILGPDGKKTDMPPLCNELGVNFFINLIMTVMDRTTYLGSINEKKYNEEVFYLGKAVIDGITLNAEKFGIEKEYYDVIYEKMITKIEHALSFPLNSGIRNYLKTSHQVKHLITQDNSYQQHKKNGFFNFFNRD